MKKFLPLLLLLVLGGGLAAYFMYNKSHVETKDTKADIALKPAELLGAYEADETKADAMYLDKIIEVTGVVKELNQVETGASLSLDTGNEMSSIICEFEDKIALVNVKPGDQITVKGFCTGKLMDVVLVRCSI